MNAFSHLHTFKPKKVSDKFNASPFRNTSKRLLNISNLAWKQRIILKIPFLCTFFHCTCTLSLLDKILLFLLCSFLPSTGVLRALIRHCIDINTSGPTYLGTFAHMNLVQNAIKRSAFRVKTIWETIKTKKTLLRDDTFFINTRKNMKNTPMCALMLCILLFWSNNQFQNWVFEFSMNFLTNQILFHKKELITIQ